MPSHPRSWCAWTLTAVAFGSMGIYAQRGPALPDLRRAAADYLVKYAQELSAVAAEEEYLQLDTSAVRMTATSSLRSEFVLVGLADGAVTGFRDVFDLDGSALRERADSLLTLFRTPPTAASLERALELTTESARHYISPDLRWLDEPTLALEFLRQKNQERSTFTLDGVRKMDGSQVAILKFKERSTPRLIPSPDNPPASGSFWIEVVSGAVRRTELILSGKSFDFRATVNYAAKPELDLWLPVDMHQRIDISGVDAGGSSQLGDNFSYPARRSFEAHAKYSKFRKLSVMSRQKTTEDQD